MSEVTLSRYDYDCLVYTYGINKKREERRKKREESCEHVYGYDNDYDYGGLLEYEKVENADIIFTYCPLCGKKL